MGSRVKPEDFRQRRNKVRENVGEGVILWLGHVLQPRNYVDNTYPFRQNSHLLYYTGLSAPDLAVLSYPERDYDILFSRPSTMDDIIWSGGGEDRLQMARNAGIETVEDIDRLGAYLTKAAGQGLEIHYLPPYQATSLFRIAELLVIDPTDVIPGASMELAEAVACQRSVKSAAEIQEIEYAVEVTGRMHRAAMETAGPGVYEFQIAGTIEGVALKENCPLSFPPIVTVRGEVLHNHSYDNVLREGQLLLNDSGAESPGGYAGDITRTFPVSGKFSPIQREVYEVVLRSQMEAIRAIRPGAHYRDVHLRAATVITEGLQRMGLMRGNTADAVEAGAHALFFPHGIGHMLGLDVHDMEDLGDVVGYSKGEKRNPQFGLNALRLSRLCEPGYVVTVEPGVYFIPALIDRWRQDRMHKEFIDYEKLEDYRTFGGIRIEDNVLVTETGSRVLGPAIPKTIEEIEQVMAG